ncbi:DNA polymerase IV [Janthinobacterium agaricidamnosum]|uniref:DNA polymerase IV n=1 Tax=Janthinobacterium agaricidamnosum NBRC 102515 = DSM 9628 TaxID=1349767 RepID=W0V0H5_9BURK|nr:DNA polymerase IV [Janthinobacterium agaricidamnosum]CDG80787.1 impB/mucB/samB family protein [Janthinobacterium agaricidamnosum NBRC 102515 = DSM 9628]
MSEPARCIAHLDMDAFFASVELLKYPELRGRAVVVGGGKLQQPLMLPDGNRKFSRISEYAGRGVVTTSTYEARAFGIFSAMGIMKAAKLAPDSILLPADFESYRHYSAKFKEAVARIAPVIENVGIDEIYIDLSGAARDPRLLASEIKQAVFSATGLSCSIGLAPNKLLAKICSDLDKPNGLTILSKDDIQARVWPLPAKKINGIGPKASAKLSALGITTIGELAHADVALLLTQFGQLYTSWLHASALGIDERPLRTTSEAKSISREVTFERDLQVVHDRPLLSERITHLCERVADDLKKHELVGRTVGIKLRFEDFSTVTRDVTLPDTTADPAMILRAARDCLRRVPFEKKIRLLGVRISTLSAPSMEKHGAKAQAELFPQL